MLHLELELKQVINSVGSKVKEFANDFLPSILGSVGFGAAGGVAEADGYRWARNCRHEAGAHTACNPASSHNHIPLHGVPPLEIGDCVVCH